jgi:glycosyltransferase involved in cell wall biosynthesis
VHSSEPIWRHGAIPTRRQNPSVCAVTRRVAAPGHNLPALSVGLAVRNGRDTVGRCIESVLSQDFSDLELIVSDNASDDDTVDVVESYARMDRRITLNVNTFNVGAHENMNLVLAAAGGDYFRWISADDWLEPGCLSACGRVLACRPEAVGVTNWFTIHTDDGTTRYEEYRGEFPTSPDPARRFERMLWFFHAGDARYDPMYGVYRRQQLMRSGRLRPSERTDWLLSAELALMGPIAHVDRRLANRTRSYPGGVDRAAFRRRLDPVRGEELRTTPRRLSRDLDALVRSADLTDEQLRRCRRAIRRFFVNEVARTGRTRASDAWHRVRAEYRGRNPS